MLTPHTTSRIRPEVPRNYHASNLRPCQRDCQCCPATRLFSDASGLYLDTPGRDWSHTRLAQSQLNDRGWITKLVLMLLPRQPLIVPLSVAPPPKHPGTTIIRSTPEFRQAKENELAALKVHIGFQPAISRCICSSPTRRACRNCPANTRSILKPRTSSARPNVKHWSRVSPSGVTKGTLHSSGPKNIGCYGMAR